MDDTPPNENPSKDFNKLDLTQLQSFSFGTQWTQDKADKSGRPAGRDDRPPRREDHGGPGGDPRRDRRGFRKPAGPGDSAGPAGPAGGGQGAGAGAPAGPGGGGGDFRGGPRRDDRRGGPGGNFGPRRDGPGGGYAGGQGGGGRGYDRGGEGGQRFGGPRENIDRGPYISPFFTISFYPEDTGFTALAKAIRTSCRTYELFEIARVIIGKNDRFVAVLQRKAPEGQGDGAAAAPSTPAAPFAIAVPDGMPFENEEAAVAHVLGKHLAQFFDTAEVEIEAPKGNYQVVNRCGVTGELLGPPNYHRYNQIVMQHYTAKASRMPFEAYRARIETVRDPELVNQWLEKMKKTTRYTWKFAAEGDVVPTFDNLEDARIYLITHAKEKVVRFTESVRFHGRLVDTMPPGEIKAAIEGAVERQRRFPLDTANALRGRLRREGFTIFKKGSKGISYVCAVKRKFRVPGQTFADSIGALIGFIEANPMVKASELPQKFLGITVPAPVKPVDPAAPAAPVAAAPAGPALTPQEQQKLARLSGDLRWLVSEGYVTEFIDGRLFAPPAMVEARKKEIEGAEHDPENFPDAPPATETPAPAPAPAAAAPAAALAVSDVQEPATPAEPDPAAVEAPVEETTPPAATA